MGPMLFAWNALLPELQIHVLDIIMLNAVHDGFRSDSERTLYSLADTNLNIAMQLLRRFWAQRSKQWIVAGNASEKYKRLDAAQRICVISCIKLTSFLEHRVLQKYATKLSIQLINRLQKPMPSFHPLLLKLGSVLPHPDCEERLWLLYTSLALEPHYDNYGAQVLEANRRKRPYRSARLYEIEDRVRGLQA